MMPNSDLKVLGEKVRKERKLAGLTQEQLAERCHVSTKHIKPYRRILLGSHGMAFITDCDSIAPIPMMGQIDIQCWKPF